MVKHVQPNSKTSDSSTKPIPNKNISKPKPNSIDQMLHLQRTVGNRAVNRLIDNGTLQPKQSSGHPAHFAGRADASTNSNSGDAGTDNDGLIQRKEAREEEGGIRRDYFEKAARQPDILREGIRPLPQRWDMKLNLCDTVEQVLAKRTLVH